MIFIIENWFKLMKIVTNIKVKVQKMLQKPHIGLKNLQNLLKNTENLIVFVIIELIQSINVNDYHSIWMINIVRDR
jgi:hypothetical protein